MSLITLRQKFEEHQFSPRWIAQKLTSPAALMKAYYLLTYSGEPEIVEEDWDLCIILDGCRYDMFAEQNPLVGHLEKRQSRGSATPQFLKENFENQTHHDIVYVTANPQVNLHLEPEQQFHAVVNVWEDEWDDDLKTVPPEAIADATIEVAERYPQKRIISHFVQPNYPFIGTDGRRDLGTQRGIEGSRNLIETGERATSDNHDVWTKLERGEVDIETVWRAYRENLDICFPHVERLVDSTVGTTVVTSDHGNMVGEFAWPFPVRLYGHPLYMMTEELVTVPWLVIEDDERRSIVSEPPIAADANEADERKTKNRLQNLGYM